MRVDVITIFPEMFDAPMSTSIVGIARQREALEFHVHDLRDWTDDPHRTTDDSPYGGGPGMVMKPEPVFRAVHDVAALSPQDDYTIFLTPVGQTFTQSIAEDLAQRERIVLVCGRYEGFDERTYELADLRLSVGDYVLSGGELPAMLVVDAMARLLPGVLGHDASAAEESFTMGLLEYPQYTRPADFQGRPVPDILRSGDHARIAAWRREQAIRNTARHRPDMLAESSLTEDERVIAEDALREDAQRDD